MNIAADLSGTFTFRPHISFSYSGIHFLKELSVIMILEVVPILIKLFSYSFDLFGMVPCKLIILEMYVLDPSDTEHNPNRPFDK